MALAHDGRGGAWDEAALEAGLTRGDAEAERALAAALARVDPRADALLRRAVAERVAWAKRLVVWGLRDGAPWAWRVYDAWYVPRVRAICARYLRDPWQAEECAERVRVAFVARYADTDGPLQSFPGYLYAMATHAAWRHRQRLVAAAEAAEALQHAQTAAGPPSPDALLAQREVMARLREGLATLGDEEQALLRERYVEERGLKEMAAARGCSHQNVDQRIKRLFGRLRRLIDRRDPHEHT